MPRELGIDIAVDLKGYTRGSRTGIFAARAAPIQVNYLGFPGPLSADYLDYIIADATLIPASNRRHFTAKVAYLPDSYQPNDSKRASSKRRYSREELQLPAGAFVYCCFNNSYKITPRIFESWMHMLRQVEGSVLWLLEDNPKAAANLRAEASAAGVDAGRLIFAQRIPLSEHLARCAMADLFLDTLPCNAHTTASDALWAGLPVLTCMGESFAARVASSLLKAVYLPELITTTQQDYESLAIELATRPERLKEIRAKLLRSRLQAPLFDTQRFARNIEQAYMQMYDRHHADLPPDHIFVVPKEDAGKHIQI